MAVDILTAIVMNAPITHEPKHDIESITHILRYALTRCLLRDSQTCTSNPAVHARLRRFAHATFGHPSLDNQWLLNRGHAPGRGASCGGAAECRSGGAVGGAGELVGAGEAAAGIWAQTDHACGCIGEVRRGDCRDGVMRCLVMTRVVELGHVLVLFERKSLTDSADGREQGKYCNSS
jgi:hypothetical protein